jgi:hypothetical protein
MAAFLAFWAAWVPVLVLGMLPRGTVSSIDDGAALLLIAVVAGGTYWLLRPLRPVDPATTPTTRTGPLR